MLFPRFLHNLLLEKSNMGKEKKEKRKSEGGEDGDKEGRWNELVGKVSPIANPLASRKLTKKLYKTVKKGTHVLF